MHERLSSTSNRGNPDRILIHVGTNDIPTRRQLDVIVEDIIQLALKLNTSDIPLVFVAGNEHYRNQASAVNRKQKDLCKEKNLHYLDHSKSINTRYLNGSKIHL